jgi:alpha-mannosidase
MLDTLWEDLCRNHFHDTLPGSSIAMCVKDSDEKYLDIQRMGNELLDDALNSLGMGETTTGSEEGLVYVNTVHSISRTCVIDTATRPVVVSVQAPSIFGKIIDMPHVPVMSEW